MRRLQDRLWPEFKALGIPRGTPYYQLKDREFPKGDLVFCSSNYELYGDLSRRIVQVLRERAVDVEQYSIDEAFIRPPTTEFGDLVAYGRDVRAHLHGEGPAECWRPAATCMRRWRGRGA